MKPDEKKRWLYEEYAFAETMRIGKKQVYKKGETIDYAALGGFVYLKKGGVNAFYIGENGEEVFAFKISGETCFYVGRHYSYRFSTPSEIYVIEKEQTLLMSEKDPEFKLYVTRVAYERDEEFISRLNTILFGNVDKKIALFLLSESNRARSATVKYTQEEIAVRIGAARETVSRRLKALEKAECISRARGKITILNKDELRKNSR